MMRLLCCFILLFMLILPGYAWDEDDALDLYTTPVATQQSAGFKFGIEMQAGYENMSFSRDNASSISLLNLRPFLDWENWELSLLLPLEQVRNPNSFFQKSPANALALCTRIRDLPVSTIRDYLNRGLISSSALNFCSSHHLLTHAAALPVTTTTLNAQQLTSQTCNNIDSLSLGQLRRLERQGTLTTTIASFCRIPQILTNRNDVSQASGLGDVGLEIDRNLPSVFSWLESRLSLIGTFDNASAAQGLGSGAPTTSLQSSSVVHAGPWIEPHLNLGYTWVGSNSQMYTNFPYAEADLFFFPSQAIQPGLSYNYQPATPGSLTDSSFLTVFLDWHISRPVTLHLYMHHYLQTGSGEPSRDIGLWLDALW